MHEGPRGGLQQSLSRRWNFHRIGSFNRGHSSDEQRHSSTNRLSTSAAMWPYSLPDSQPADEAEAEAEADSEAAEDEGEEESEEKDK